MINEKRAALATGNYLKPKPLAVTVAKPSLLAYARDLVRRLILAI